MRLRVAAAALALSASAAGWAQQVPPEAEPAPDALALVRQGRCVDAAKALNEQLKAGDVATQVLAGALFEVGLCMKKDWARAEAFYLKAAGAGSSIARMRLAAGYPDASAGADHAASLWWAHVADVPRPADCTLVRFDKAMDPDDFVKQVQGWGAAKVKACAFVGGVVAGTIAALQDAEVPTGSPATVVRLLYLPGEGRFTGRRFEAGRAVEERRWGLGDSPAGTATPLDLLRTVSLAAATRYGPPPGMDPSWRVELEAQFGGLR
jgi:hypothetical protein